MPAGWLNRFALVGVLLACATPLFVGLDRTDMENDEAIYSYAVERMLDTGDWVTPRYIPSDAEFLEKPPLKMWLVAGLMATGVLPRDDFGMRALDAAFGTIAFIYVWAFGRRLRGALAGAFAVLVLFTHYELIFEHGLRTNSMEGALTLAYTGGLWHALRWVEAGERARRHAWGLAAYVVLGFMTKYIAAIFLPAIAGLVWVWRPGGFADLRQRWTDWVGPIAAAVVLIAPWFLYETWVHGREFWAILLGEQAVQRFTTGVDPDHLAPWHFYFSRAWRVFHMAGTEWLVIVGAGLVVAQAIVKRDVAARLLVVWWWLPIALISLGSSKLPHYVYPFLPPLALGAGLAFHVLVDFSWRAVTDVARWQRARPPGRLQARLRPHVTAVFVVAAALVILAAWTAVSGPVELLAGDVRLFRNSSVARPLIVAATLLIAVGRTQVLVFALLTAALVTLVPWRAYAFHVDLTRRWERPLGALSDCIATGARPGFLVTDPDRQSHTFAYYLLRTGPRIVEPHQLEDIARHLLSPDPTDQRPVLMRRTTWRTARQSLGTLVRLPDDPLAVTPFDHGLELHSGSDVLLIPPLFRHCLPAAIAAGGEVLTVTTEDVDGR